MIRTELQHRLRVEAWTLCLYSQRPVGRLTNEQEIACLQRCREQAERDVAEYEARGLFTVGIGKVA